MSLSIESPDKKITTKAKANVIGPGIKANAIFTEYDINGAKYVHLKLDVKSQDGVLNAGEHAVHIHEKGECDCDGFKCAGGHFDPGP